MSMPLLYIDNGDIQMCEYKFHSTNEMMQNAPKRCKFWGLEGRGGGGVRVGWAFLYFKIINSRFFSKKKVKENS
jgi:hypothetical protein